MNIIALCDKDTAIGLRLAGIHEILIPDEKEMKSEISKLIEKVN